MAVFKKGFKLVKLDRRMSGHTLFSHRIEVFWLNDYLTYRDWMFKSFGVGCELNLFTAAQKLELGYTWAWRVDDGKKEIYLTQEQLSYFILYTT